jgi:dTDP-4-dehydrorhamnose reductase
MAGPGWWRRPERLLFPDAAAQPGAAEGPPVLIVGATGTFGRALTRLCRLRGLTCVPLGRAELDITSPDAVAAALAAHRPWAVVNAAGYARVDSAEADPVGCRRVNLLGSAVLAEVCAGAGSQLLTFSTDLVFDGRAGRPYREGDPVSPLSVYGRSKAEAEAAVSARHPAALIVRTGAVYGPWDERNFVARALRRLRGGAVVPAADDVTVTPSYLPDLLEAALDLLIDGAGGVWHLGHPEPVTWADLARAAARAAGLDAAAVRGCPAAAFGRAALRPAYSALASDRGSPLPPLGLGLARCVREMALGATA